MTTLSDHEIGHEILAGHLVRHADTARLAGACYELRMGSVYYDLTEAGKRFELLLGEAALIKPGHRVVLITAEELEISADVLVRIVSKGSLFSVGLSPVATYADPGFTGNVGIVTQNVSDKYLEIPQGEPIAKADFTRLSSAAAKPYRGQHGFQAGIWPLKTQLQKTHADVAKDPRVLSEVEEALALLPAATRTVVRRLELTQALTQVGLVIAIIFNAVALFSLHGKFAEGVFGVGTNLATSAIIGIGIFLVNYCRRI